MTLRSVVSTRNLTRSFGRVMALDGLDLTLDEGEIHGLLGPNGAGKSTTIRILLGLLRTHGGEVEVLGGDPWRDAVRLHRQMAYVPGDVALWPSLTGGEAIDVLGRTRKGVHAGRRAELIERFALDPSKKVGTYSTGNRQKVAIIAALASDAMLLILDEPTSGLDPLMESVFAACIEEERERGRSVLLSSHTLAQVERLCDRISIIRAGRVVESGSLTELRHLTRSSIRVRTRHPVRLGAHPGVHNFRVEDDELLFEVDAEAIDEVIGQLHQAGIVALTAQPPTLEELLLQHYTTQVLA